MPIEPCPEGLVFGDNDLLVFIDDTGHEALAQQGHPVYGLGGCAVQGHSYHRQVCQPWMAIRQLVTGSTDAPLHANEFSRTATPDQMQAVAQFFRDQEFFRLGAIMSINTKIGGEFSVIRVMKYVLELRINEILPKVPFCKQVRVIFESSQRADGLIAESFADLSLSRGFSKRRPAVECYFQPKASGELGLEVADFVVHAVGGQTRRRLQKRDGFARDFQAVFHSVSQKYTSYMDVEGFTLG